MVLIKKGHEPKPQCQHAPYHIPAVLLGEHEPEEFPQRASGNNGKQGHEAHWACVNAACYDEDENNTGNGALDQTIHVLVYQLGLQGRFFSLRWFYFC